MNNPFPLFNKSTELAHLFWNTYLQIGDTVVDATCGNGNDTLALAKLVIQKGQGHIFSFDIQKIAIERSQKLLETSLTPSQLEKTTLIHASHTQFEEYLQGQYISLFAYNLGYLPKGDKALHTLSETTLESLNLAFKLLKPGGIISLMCYPGHKEGAIERDLLCEWGAKLQSKLCHVTHHQKLNALNAPELVLIQKKRNDH